MPVNSSAKASKRTGHISLPTSNLSRLLKRASPQSSKALTTSAGATRNVERKARPPASFCFYGAVPPGRFCRQLRHVRFGSAKQTLITTLRRESSDLGAGMSAGMSLRHVPARRGTERLAEHRYEAGHALIAEVGGHLLGRSAAGQPLYSEHDA